MLRSLPQIYVYIWLVANLVTSTAIAQTQKSEGTMVYENRNQIDPKPLKVHDVRGTAKAEDGALIPAMTIGIFTEATHALIASTKTDENGQFSFAHIPTGRYRLVAEYPVFCTANVPILVASQSLSRSRPLIVLHMRVGGIDVCSFGDLAHSTQPKVH
jgi:hypothetical protein